MHILAAAEEESVEALRSLFTLWQVEVLLSQQEHLLSKDESASNLEQAENLLKRHEGLLTTMDANDEKVKLLFIIIYI